jgi:putative membrane protein
MALVWFGLIMLVVWAVRGPEDTSPSRRSALEILEERFARGELDSEEFTARRQQLVS